MLYFEGRKNSVFRLSQTIAPNAHLNKRFIDKQIPACFQSPFVLHRVTCALLLPFWGKHPLPETEILIWCHAALVRLRRQKRTHICFVKTHKGSMCRFVVEML